MRLLLLGSLLVLLIVAGSGALQWAVLLAPVGPAPPAPPDFRSVSLGRDANAAHADADAVVWQTSTGREDCTEVVDRRKRDEGRRLAALMSSASDSAGHGVDEEACAPFQLGEVERGVKVEIVGECGRMARIRILSGRLEGRQGCIEPDRLSAGTSDAGSSS
jgi:hypothetical protein